MTNETQNQPLEIVMAWEGTPLRQELITEGPVTVGEAGTFMLPPEVASPFTLAELDGGVWTLSTGEGQAFSLAGGVPTPISGPITLLDGEPIELRLGSFTLAIRVAEVVEATPRAGVTIDRDVARYVGGSFVLAMLMLGMFLLVPPNVSALNADLSGSQAEYIRVQLDAIQEMQPETPVAPQPSGMEGEGSRRGVSTEAGDGEPGPAENTGRSQMRHHETAGAPITAEHVNNLGTLAALRGFSQSITPGGSPFGDLDTTGLSWLQSRGEIGGDGIFGGLDMDRIFRGVCTTGNCSNGTVRVGDLIGDDVPRGPRGNDVRLRDRDPEGGTPDWHPGPVETFGGLTRADIQRVVRRHKPEVRHCYEQGLISRPDLEGRVSVRFIVQPDGHVSTSVTQSQSLGSDRVSECVSSAVYRWGFPQSEGITAVTYPFVFHTN